MSYKISYTENPTSEEEQVLIEGIIHEAKKVGKKQLISPFAFLVKDNQGKIRGGAKGATYYGCLYVDLLWVTPELRKAGLGTKLIEASEKLGKEKGCTFASLTTMDWEALDFYQKLGYSIEYKREGYENNSIMYVLRKNLGR